MKCLGCSAFLQLKALLLSVMARNKYIIMLIKFFPVILLLLSLVSQYLEDNLYYIQTWCLIDTKDTL